MPIVTITARAGGLPDVRRVAEALGPAIGHDANDCWVYWHPVAAATHDCPVVVIRSRAGRDDKTVAAALTATAHAVAETLNVPIEDVWVTWQDVEPRHVFAGGSVLDETR